MIGPGEVIAVVIALICVMITNVMIFVMRHGKYRGKVFFMIVYDITALYVIFKLCTMTDQTLLWISCFILYTSGFNMIVCEGK